MRLKGAERSWVACCMAAGSNPASQGLLRLVRWDCLPGTQFESSRLHIGFVTNHGLEFCDRVSRLHQRRHSHLDGGDGNCVSSRQIVTSDRHRPRDGAGRRDALQIFDIRSLRTSPAGSPFGDDSQGARNPSFLRRRQRFDPLRHPDAHSFAIDISAGDSIEISVILQREPRPLGRKRATCTTGTTRGGGKLSRSRRRTGHLTLSLTGDSFPDCSRSRTDGLSLIERTQAGLLNGRNVDEHVPTTTPRLWAE